MSDATDTRFWHGLREDARMLTRHHRGRPRKAAVLLFSRSFKAVGLQRLGHALHRAGVPALPGALHRLGQALFAVDLSPKARLGPGVVLVHGFGTVVGSAVEATGDLVLYHGVTLGDRGSEWVGSRRTDGHPRLGRGVMLGAGAKVLGPVSVGDNVVVGANSVVLQDVPANAVAAGLPAKVVNHRPRMDAALRPVDGHRADADGDADHRPPGATAPAPAFEPAGDPRQEGKR